MRWWFVVAMLGACENPSDFPGPPGELRWSTMEVVVHRGTLDGTTYQVELPRGLASSEKIVDRTATFNMGSLTVVIELDQEARPIDYIVGDNEPRTLRDDGWSATEKNGSSSLNYVYVDEGGILCRATVLLPVEGESARVGQICASMKPTSALANPLTYPDGLAPSKVRTVMCHLALHHVRELEPVAKPGKKKKTKEQRAAEEKRALDLEAEYTARQTRCERQRWTSGQINCLTQVASLDEARACVPW